MPTSFIHLLILTSLGIAIAAAQSRPPQTPPQGQPPQRPAKRGWSFWLSSEEPDYRSFAPVTYSQQLHDGGTINSSRDLLVQYGYVDTPESKNSLISDLLPLGFLLEPGPVQAFSPSDGKALQLRCPNGTCSTESQCGPFYRCLFGQLPTREGGLDWTVDLSDTLPGCLEGAYLATQKRQEQRPGDQGSAPGASIPQWGLQCPLTLVNITSSDQRPCSDDGLFERSLDNWQVQTRTDENIQIFLRGGVDLSGVWWPGKGSGTVTQELGRQMGKNDFDCSLTLPCQPSSDLDCAAIGLRQAPWKEVIRCKWGLFALTAIENISQHLTSSYAALDAINVTAILDGFKIDDFRPKGGTKFTNLDFLRGLGNVFAVAAGFAPAALPRTTPNNLILPGQGAFLSAVSASLSQNNAGSGATDVSQDDFNSEVEKVYDQLKGALDGIVKILFSGEALNGVSLTDMLRDGAWVNATTIPNVGDISQQLRIEILSRAINDLWKIFSSNKRWVLFVDLQDDPANQAKCIADNTGPQDLKYCGDGGVYYSYNYVETGDHDGHTDYPWGAEKLQNLGIDMRWITESSAKAYRLAKSNASLGLDPFNLDTVLANSAYLTQLYASNDTIDFAALAGRYPGTWTLPVCDGGTWAARWNFNWKEQTGGYPSFGPGFPPCLCGQGGLESKAWASAAGMKDFDTFYRFCHNQLESEYFTWPEGVTSVDYGFNNPLKKLGT